MQRIPYYQGAKFGPTGLPGKTSHLSVKIPNSQSEDFGSSGPEVVVFFDSYGIPGWKLNSSRGKLNKYERKRMMCVSFFFHVILWIYPPSQDSSHHQDYILHF